VPAPSAPQHPPRTGQQGCGGGQGKVTPPRQEKQAIKNQSTCLSAAISGRAGGRKVPHVPHGSWEHPRGQEHRDGDPTGDALAGEEGGKAGAVLGAGGPPRDPPHAAAGAKEGAGSRSWQSSQRLAGSARYDPGDAACRSRTGRWNHPHTAGIRPTAPQWGLQHPPQEGAQGESRAGGGAGA